MLPFDGGGPYDHAAVEPHDCAGPAVSDVTMFGSLSCPGKPHSRRSRGADALIPDALARHQLTAHARLFNHLVGHGQQRRWHGKSQRLGGLEVDE